MVYELKEWFRARWFSLIFHLPLHRCACGSKPVLRSNYYGTLWKVECDNHKCHRNVFHTYHKPLKAVIMWNFKNWKHYYI